MCNKKNVVSMVIFLIAIFISSSVISENERVLFDHFDTNFPLTGQHINVDCSACHINGVFRGTTQVCSLCHNGIMATGKPANHFRSDDNCDNCHTTFSMSDARFEHDNITAPCSSCHNGVIATGQNIGHTATAQECDICHITTSWLNVRFDHSQVTAPCSSCHNGSNATGMPSKHIVSTLECDSCHVTSSWLNVRFDHSQVTAPCSYCHNGVNATGKPTTGHVTTTQECDVCHTTTAWSNVTFVHSSIGNHNSSVSCNDCHGNNYSVPFPWPFPTYAPDCAACHRDDYKQTEHKKTEVPSTVFYTVDELSDCSGSCHLYQDNSFTTIKDTRSGEHRLNASQF